jgi:DNA-binding transcriptional ArsR family regulator
MSNGSHPESAPDGPSAPLDDLLEARFFKALGDPNRLAVLIRLAECCRPCTVGELAHCCPVDVSVVSRHLGLLRDAGIVRCERHGREVRCSVDHAVLASMFRRVADAIEACCGSDETDDCSCASSKPPVKGQDDE